MSTLVSILFYLILLLGVSFLLFFSLVSTWETNEPVIAYLLSLIFSHLLLNNFEYFGKK